MSAKEPLHIGIAAITAGGASLAYRTICAEAPLILGTHQHPEISLHSFSLSKYYDEPKNNMESWAELVLASSKKLAQSGADFFICAANTTHEVYNLVAPKAPIPWLHIGEAVAEEMKLKGLRKAGLLGTKQLMEGPVYANIFQKHGLEYVVPKVEQRNEMNKIVFEELVLEKFLPESRKRLYAITEELIREGVDSIILGCTEYPLIMAQEDIRVPALDSTRILARAALKQAITTQISQ